MLAFKLRSVVVASLLTLAGVFIWVPPLAAIIAEGANPISGPDPRSNFVFADIRPWNRKVHHKCGIARSDEQQGG